MSDLNRENRLAASLLWGSTIVLVVFAIASQLYTLSVYKAFWLDEWFILDSLKFKSYAQIFGELFHIQQFPRTYLVIIKWLAEITNYNYYALRFFPTLMEIINIFLIVFLISKILYKQDLVKRILFIWFFLALQTTVFYFTQLKQYTMEMFLALLSVYFFHLLSVSYGVMKVRSVQYLGLLFFIGGGLFFSYTFPFVVAPILLMLFITVVHGFKIGKLEMKAMIPILVFLVAIILNYFTDLRYVLNNENQYSNFDDYVMNYDSLRTVASRLYNIIRLLAYNIHYAPESHSAGFVYVLHALKVLLIFLVCTGIFVSLKSEIERAGKYRGEYISKLSFRNSPSWDFYMLVILFLTIALYLVKLLPLGQGRLNYYAYIFNTYFLIRGMDAIGTRFIRLKPILVISVYFIAVSQIVRIYSNEFKNTNLLFDQEIYNNVGKAINKAYEEDLPIVVYRNEFLPRSILSNTESLMIRSHHNYKPQRAKDIYVVDSTRIAAVLDSIRLTNFIHVKKHTYILKRTN